MFEIHDRSGHLIHVYSPFLLFSKRFLKIETYNKKARWINCLNNTVSSRCYSLDMIFDLLEFVLYNTYIRFNSNLYQQIVEIPIGGGEKPTALF